MPEASQLNELNPFSDELAELRDELNEQFREYNDYHRDAEGPNGLTVYLGPNGFSVEDRVSTVTADTTLDDTHRVVLVNLSSADITITLATAVGNTGLEYWIKNIGSSSYNIIVDGDGTETIDGFETLTLVTSVHIVSDGTEWWILS